MSPQEIERQRESMNLMKTILEDIKSVKEYQLEIIKGQKEILEGLRSLKKTA